MKKKSTEQYAKALYSVIQETEKKQYSDVVKAFVTILAKDRVLSRANHIINAFISYSKKQEGIIELTITSARELDKKTVNKVSKIFGESVETTTQIDIALLGGFTARTSNTILDASTKTQIRRLQTHLTH